MAKMGRGMTLPCTGDLPPVTHPGTKHHPALLRATARRGVQWCYRHAEDGRDGRDGIDDTEKESKHSNALQNPFAWSLGQGFIFI